MLPVVNSLRKSRLIYSTRPKNKGLRIFKNPLTEEQVVNNQIEL